MIPLVKYIFIGLGLITASIAALIVAAVNEDLRTGALIASAVFLLAYFVVRVLRFREWRRHVAALKATNGGALPIPNPAQARLRFTIFVSVWGGLGIVALVAAVFVEGTAQLVLTIVGAASLLASVLLGIQGWWLFRRRAAADAAASNSETSS
jgi:small-conductance mechanosensitive channel